LVLCNCETTIIQCKLQELPAHRSPYIDPSRSKRDCGFFSYYKEFPNKRTNSLHLLIEAATTQYIIQVS